MFGYNKIIGQKFFKDKNETLLVTSVFYTLQGEGPYAGRPALFIRLTHCNLTCSFCDTFFDAGQEFTFPELEALAIKTIEDYHQTKITQELLDRIVLVMTGGEPMLQQSIVSWFEYIHPTFRTIQIESNGTVYQDIPDYVTLVVSPKCAEKDGVPTKYLNIRQSVLTRADCLKFVVSADESSPYHTIPEWAAAANKIIYISPMNVYNDLPKQAKELRACNKEISIEERSTVDEIISFWEPGLLNLKANQANHEYAAKYCLEHGYRLNLQMHLYVSMA